MNWFWECPKYLQQWRQHSCAWAALSCLILPGTLLHLWIEPWVPSQLLTSDIFKETFKKDLCKEIFMLFFSSFNFLSTLYSLCFMVFPFLLMWETFPLLKCWPSPCDTSLTLAESQAGCFLGPLSFFLTCGTCFTWALIEHFLIASRLLAGSLLSVCSFLFCCYWLITIFFIVPFLEIAEPHAGFIWCALSHYSIKLVVLWSLAESSCPTNTLWSRSCVPLPTKPRAAALPSASSIPCSKRLIIVANFFFYFFFRPWWITELTSFSNLILYLLIIAFILFGVSNTGLALYFFPVGIWDFPSWKIHSDTGVVIQGNGKAWHYLFFFFFLKLLV